VPVSPAKTGATPDRDAYATLKEREMNKDRILKQVFIRCIQPISGEIEYVCESPFNDSIVGFGDTEQKACDNFVDEVNREYLRFLEERVNKIIRKSGRPKMDRTTFLHPAIRPIMKAKFEMLANKLSFSHGELIEYLFQYYCLSEGADQIRQL